MQNRVLFSFLLAFLLPVALLQTLSCSDPGRSPRETVLDFVRLVQGDSLVDVSPYFDLTQAAENEYAAEKYDTLTLQEKKNRFYSSFVKGGYYRQMFVNSQIVINEERFLNDSTALVEVSYIDRTTRIQYYTQVGLTKQGEYWLIYDMEITDSF